MKIVRDVASLGEALAAERDSARVGFVPTMGALHAGHVSLLRRAREECSRVVVSIYVNPLQFGPNEDLSRYPRPESDDLRACEAAGVDVAFLPTDSEMYPSGRTTTVRVGEIGDVLEGASRPGHFDGVATVVARLFNLVAPDVAYFGQKDAQQVAVVKRMVRDLGWPVRVEVGTTVREADGLALSSRNVYLSKDERRDAIALWEALERGRDVLLEVGDADLAEKAMWEALVSREGVAPDYARAVDPDSFGPPRDTVLLVVAARVGNTRLIDNLLVERN